MASLSVVSSNAVCSAVCLEHTSRQTKFPHGGNSQCARSSYEVSRSWRYPSKGLSSTVVSSLRPDSSFAQVRLHSARRSLQCHSATAEEVDTEKEIIETNALEKMEKSLDSVRNNFNSVRTGRASVSLLDRIEVEYYGAMCSLKAVAQISTPDGSTILVSPFDKSSLQSIEKAIQKSDLGLNPSNDGTAIRLSIPQLTAERRKELLKTVSKLAEDGKVALRNVRRDAIKSYERMEKDKKISEDNVKDLSDEIQKLTDEYVKKVESLFKAKEKELKTV